MLLLSMNTTYVGIGKKIYNEGYITYHTYDEELRSIPNFIDDNRIKPFKMITIYINKG